MKVFYCREALPYSGGGVLVAAPTREEAVAAFVADEHYLRLWYADENGYYQSDDYPSDGFRELKGLNYDTDKPCVILENGYAE